MRFFYYVYNTLSLENKLKISYVETHDIRLSDLNDNEEKYSSNLNDHRDIMKQKYGENYWVELGISNISFVKDMYQVMNSSSRALLIIKDWRFSHEFEYMNNLKEVGLIGNLYKCRIFTDDKPMVIDSFLDTVETDGVVFALDNILTTNNIIYQINTKFPQFQAYDYDIIDV